MAEEFKRAGPSLAQCSPTELRIALVGLIDKGFLTVEADDKVIRWSPTQKGKAAFGISEGGEFTLFGDATG